MSRYVNFYTDFAFKKFFGTEANKDFLISFLNALLELEGEKEIADLTYLNTEQLGFNNSDRRAIYDVYCQTKEGKRFIVEMQKVKQENFKDRALYYSSFAIQEQAQKGTKDNSAHWDYKLSPVYVVGILDFMMEDTAQRAGDIITKVQLKDEHNEVFNENLNFIFIEMPKFRKTESELQTIMDKWLYAIKNLGKLDDKPVALTEAIFNRFFEVAEIAAFSKTERYDYEENLKNYTDWFNVLSTAKKEGLVEGRAEGIAEGRAVGLAEGLEEGKAIGLKKGRAEGEAIGVQKGRAEGEHALLTKLVLSKQEKGKSPSEIAEMLEIDIKVVEDILGNTSNKGKIEL
jgi:predicted transposase/invertase (TIGR01784 family)